MRTASGADSLAPNRRQPGLLFAWQAGRPIVVRKLDKSRLGHMAPPGVQTVKRTEAPTLPLFLVVAARVRAEQHALRFQRGTQFPQHARQLLRRHMEQRGVCEDAVEIAVRQVELKEILLPYL